MFYPYDRTANKSRQPQRICNFMAAVVLMGSALFVPESGAATDIEQLPTRGEWVRTSDSPLGARNGASVAWNGSEIFVFGGTSLICGSASLCSPPSTPPFSDGAAYNPSTNTWRVIAGAPTGIIAGYVATVGNDIFALAMTSYTRSFQLLRYQPDLDEWDEFRIPEDLRSWDIVALGTDIILYTTSHEYGPVSDWRLDTMTGQWTQMPESPLGLGFSRQYVPHGEDLYLFDHERVSNPGAEPSYLRAARMRQQQWELLPQSDSIGMGQILIADSHLVAPELGCADGGQTNGYGRCIAFGAVFDTTSDTWHDLPNAPGRDMKYVRSSGGVSDTHLLLTEPGHPALDAVTGEWFIVPQLDSPRTTQRTVHAAGPYGFAFGGASITRNELLRDAWIWQP